MFVVYYFIMLLPVVFSCAVAPRFYWKRIFRRGFRKVFFGSELAGDYFNIQKSWCMGWWVVVFVIMVCFESVFDWEIVWIVCCGCFCDRFYDWLTRDSFRVCFDGLFFGCFWLRNFGLFFLIVWFDWLFRLVVFCWTVVILLERRKIMVGRCIASLLLLNPMSKWVRSGSSGWSFDLGVYCLLWKRFLVLNVVLRAAQVKSFAE